ncbi:MAG: DUF5916 domain-containing protein [Acidobacteriota bacterium]
METLLGLLFWGAAGVGMTAAQSVNPGTKTAQAQRVEEAPVIDGDFTEAVWADAPIVSHFSQRNPEEGEMATERTEVRIIYNDQSIFFGVICYDSEPDAIIAMERARDGGSGGGGFNGAFQSDDTFEIILDTFHSHQDGFLFRTNPLGTKYDSWITDEGSLTNANWDELWNVATSRNEAGWTAEIEIPFQSIRMSDDPEQVWGIDFKRNIRRKNEEVIWSNYRRNFDFAQVSQAGDLFGLRNISSEHKLRIKPYVTAGASRVLSDGLPKTQHLFDAGLEDVKYQLTSSLILDFTLNPDFAQAEVDEQVSNLTRFSVFFPEKREFFQENASLFEFGPRGFRPELKLFHSRTVGLSEDREPIGIIAGLKLTGQLQGLEVGVFNAQTEEFKGTPGSNYSAVRVRKKVLPRSNVGVMMTNRQSGLEDDYNRTLGVDGSFVFFENLSLESFFALSQTPDLEEDEWAARPLRVSWDTDFLSAGAEHSIIGRNFNAEMGFIPRTDMKKSALDFQINPRPGSEAIRQLDFSVNVDYITNLDNIIETREQEVAFRIDFESGDRIRFGYTRTFEYLDEGFLLRGIVPVPAGSYDGSRWSINLNPYRARRFSGRIQFQREHFWDGNRTTFNWTPQIRWSDSLSFEVQYRWDKLKLPGGDLSSKVSNIRMNYNVSNDWLTSTTLQYDNVEDLLNLNFRLNWIYQPGDDLFLVFSQTRQSDNTDRGVILKFTHSFDF